MRPVKWRMLFYWVTQTIGTAGQTVDIANGRYSRSDRDHNFFELAFLFAGQTFGADRNSRIADSHNHFTADAAPIGSEK